MTLSPNHRYGVTVQNKADWLAAQDLPVPKNPVNEIIEIKTGRSLGIIQTDDAFFENENHADLVPTLWSADASTLLWLVDGKWGFATEILIKLENGKIKSQIDVLKLLEKEMLKRTHEALPDKYAEVKKGGEGDGSWFQDGFAIDCVPDQKNNMLTFPLLFQAYLSSDPKAMGEEIVDARMTAVLLKDGTIQVRDFHRGKTPPARNW